MVEVSTTLSDKLWGRRWESLARWCQSHGARFFVFVHPEDQERARSIARHWKLEPQWVVPLERTDAGRL